MFFCGFLFFGLGVVFVILRFYLVFFMIIVKEFLFILQLKLCYIIVSVLIFVFFWFFCQSYSVVFRIIKVIRYFCCCCKFFGFVEEFKCRINNLGNFMIKVEYIYKYFKCCFFGNFYIWSNLQQKKIVMKLFFLLMK